MKNPNLKFYLFLFLTISLTSTYTYLFSFFPFKYYYGISISFMIFLTGIVIWKLLEQHIYCFIYFMFNTKYIGYNKLIEKPRLAFHIIIIPLMLFTFIQFLNFINNGYHLLNIEYLIKVLGIKINLAMIESALYLSFFNVGVLLSFLTRTKNFEEKFVPKIKEKLENKVILQYNIDSNLEDLFEKELIGNNRCIITFENLILFSQGQKMKEKAKWIDLKGQKSTKDATSKEINYGFIFDMLHENIIKGGIKNLTRENRRAIMELIIDNFTKGDEEIIYENLNKSYTGWKPLK
ncbi:MAG: hypothetical protein RLZZ323_1664 [Bacteroidota bacterium]